MNVERNDSERRSAAAWAGCLAIVLGLAAACAGDRPEQGDAVPQGTGFPAAPSAEPGPPPTSGEPEAPFEVRLRVSMPEHEFSAESSVKQGTIFTIPDQSGEFGIGFRPDGLEASTTPAVVRLAVLDVRRPEDATAVYEPWIEISLREGEETTVPSPDGEGTLRVSLLEIVPAGAAHSTTK